MTGFAQVAFPHEASGSLVEVGWQDRRLEARRPGVREAAVLPRAALGDGARRQRSRDDVRQPRPDQRRPRREHPPAGPGDPGSSEGPYNPGVTVHNIPVDAVTTSGSGIDPDISGGLRPAPVAARRGRTRIPLATVEKLISQNTDGRSLGFFGEPGVNVLELNIALDRGAGPGNGPPSPQASSRASSRSPPSATPSPSSTPGCRCATR